MSVENVKKFYEALSQDELLQQKFAALSQKYQGQPMDEATAISIMEQEALPLAKQLGYSFSMDHLKAYGEELKQAGKDSALSDAELATVVGGWGITKTYSGFCIIFGNAQCYSTWDTTWGCGSAQYEVQLFGFCIGAGTSWD